MKGHAALIELTRNNSNYILLKIIIGSTLYMDTNKIMSANKLGSMISIKKKHKKLIKQQHVKVY